MPQQSRTFRSLLPLCIAMFIFGTIGLFRRYLDLPSGVIALARAALGTLCLLPAALKKGLAFSLLKQLWPLLLLSGTLLGLNWILLFEAYRFTTVAAATLCYYMAPLFVLLLSPFFLGESLSRRRGLCILTALAGMVLVSGVTEAMPTESQLSGLLFGLAAALCYAFIVLLNKKLTPLPATDKTLIQLAIAAITLLPYCLFTGELESLSLTGNALFLLLLLGVLHTGVAYALYFGSLGRLPAQTAALFSYLDPVVAILLSALVLQEPFTLLSAFGSALILGAAIVSELPGKHR